MKTLDLSKWDEYKKHVSTKNKQRIKNYMELVEQYPIITTKKFLGFSWNEVNGNNIDRLLCEDVSPSSVSLEGYIDWYKSNIENK